MSRIPYSTTDYGVTTLANLADVSAEGATDGQELRLESGVFTTKTPHAVHDVTSRSVSVGTAMSLTEADNTAVGDNAGVNHAGTESTFLGSGAGKDFVSGNRNICIGKDTGADAGAGNGTGSNNLIIGNGVPAVQNDRMMVLFNGDLTNNHLPSSLIGDNVMVLGGTNITDAVLCGGSLPTSSAGSKTGALFTDANGMVKCNIASPNTVFTVTQPTSTLDKLKVQCTNGDAVLKLSSEVDGNDATLTASHTDNSLTIAATQSAHIVFKTNGSEGMAVMSIQPGRAI